MLRGGVRLNYVTLSVCEHGLLFPPRYESWCHDLLVRFDFISQRAQRCQLAHTVPYMYSTAGKVGYWRCWLVSTSSRVGDLLRIHNDIHYYCRTRPDAPGQRANTSTFRQTETKGIISVTQFDAWRNVYQYCRLLVTE